MAQPWPTRIPTPHVVSNVIQLNFKVMGSLNINKETTEQVIQVFVDNPPIPELANLPLAE